MSQTHNGTGPTFGPRVDYSPTRHAHRPVVHDVKLTPQPPPPAEAYSDHNVLRMKAHLSSPFTWNRRAHQAPSRRPFDR